MPRRIDYVFLQVVVLLLSSCSINHLPLKLSTYLVEQRMAGLNRQADLGRAEVELLENIQMLNALLKDPHTSPQFYIYSAHANFSYAFAFLEDTQPLQARQYYRHSFESARKALATYGVSMRDLNGPSAALSKKLDRLTKAAVPALYWCAMSWAKLIELKQPDLVSLVHLHKTAVLMQRVMQLDKYYHHAGPDLFFAVYYSIRPVYLGGDVKRAKAYFEKARRHNQNRLLMVDYLEAKYLQKEKADRPGRRERLRRILQAPGDIYPEQKLMNQVAKRKAVSLLSG